MPTYSDDGQWWWDGRTWQPVTQQAPSQLPQQYQQGQQPTPQQFQAPYPPPSSPPQQFAPPPGYNPSPRKRGKTLLVVGLVVLAVVAGAGVVSWKLLGSDDQQTAGTAPGRSGTGTGPGNNIQPGKTIQPGQPVTAQSLSEVDPTAFWESVATRQMVQPIGQVVASSVDNVQKFTAHDLHIVEDIAIDHRTNKFSYYQTVDEDGSVSRIACVGGKVWARNFNRPWRQTNAVSASICTRKPLYGGHDGIVSSGLTADQAAKVLASFNENQGFVNPAKPTLLTAGGKTYVRQVVDFRPVKVGDHYYGSDLADFALRDAGIDPITWPWTSRFGMGEGMHVVYYLDPATLLPVASFQKGIEPPVQSGDPAPSEPKVQVVNYAFPKALPVPKLDSSTKHLPLTLPEGWKVQ